jgi:hypothetical protein
MPLAMHLSTGATPNHGLPFREATYPLAFAGVMFPIADLIHSGVCERFPRLRFVITEFEAGWAAIMLRRLGWSCIRAGGPRSPASPSPRPTTGVRASSSPSGTTTWRCAPGTSSAPTPCSGGATTPNGDSIFPNSPATLNRILEACTPKERLTMTAANVVDLYHLPFDVPAPLEASVGAI